MRRLMKRVLAGMEKLRGGRPGSRTRGVRLALEALEDRTVPSTLYQVPNSTPTDPTHFHSFQDAYQAAAAGDLIQIEPGASAASAGAGVRGNRVAGGAAHTSTMTVDNTAIKAGEWVAVTGGGSEEDLLVTSAQVNGSQVTLTLNEPLSLNHTGAGATVTTRGILGVAKAVTLQGDPNAPRATVSSDLELPPGTAGVTFNHLDFTSTNRGVTLDPGAQHITVHDSTVNLLSEPGAANDLGNVFDGNTVLGGLVLGGSEADQVTNNQFTGPAMLFLSRENDALVEHNTFTLNTSGQDVGIWVVNSTGLQVRHNAITFATADGASIGIYVQNTSNVLGLPTNTSVTIADNTLNTGGRGTGLVLSKGVPDPTHSFGPNFQARVEQNDFHGNAVGVAVYGDGTSAGYVDLGGGPLGSVGKNDFTAFTAAGVASGYVAVSLHGTGPNAVVDAFGELWGASPAQVVKDGLRNTNRTEANGVTAPGTGQVLFPILRLPIPRPAPWPPGPFPPGKIPSPSLGTVGDIPAPFPPIPAHSITSGGLGTYPPQPFSTYPPEPTLKALHAVDAVYPPQPFLLLYPPDPI